MKLKILWEGRVTHAPTELDEPAMLRCDLVQVDGQMFCVRVPRQGLTSDSFIREVSADEINPTPDKLAEAIEKWRKACRAERDRVVAELQQPLPWEVTP